MKTEDLKKWSVTYTKHFKQKRKVYQDGFLEIHSPTNKVMLFDDCEKLLDSRFVKIDDVVRSGETLTFGSYLVDIGDPVGDHKPIPNLDIQGRDKKTTEKAGSLHGRKFNSNSISSENMKTNSGVNKVPSRNISPSQKIIREFKKSEISKYRSSPGCPDTVKNSRTEWQVLYTTQITQKAKKFHDGILKVAICGSQGRQVMLYDATRRILDSRFLKKDEIIRSGERLTFDGHLVDVGEPEGDHKPLMDLNAQGRNGSVIGKTGILHGQQFQTHNNYPVEWEAMYTTQITQKAKKYHSGVLRLASCGSYQMQVTLLTEDGTTLSHRYLKLSEDMRTGSTFQLPNYLVEVGEPRKHPQGETQNNDSAWKDGESNVRSPGVDNIILNRRIPASKPLCDGEPQNNASPWKDTGSHVTSSGFDKSKSSRRVTTNKPLRDANAILSILKQTMTHEGIFTVKRASVEECVASQSSDFVHSDLQGRPVQDSRSKRSVVEDPDEDTTTMRNYGGEVLRSEAVHNDPFIQTIKLVDIDNTGDSQPNSLTSSTLLGSEASNISKPMSDVECTDINMKMPVSYIGEPQVLDDRIVDSDGQSATATLTNDGLNGNMENGKFPELISSKVTSSWSSSQSSKEGKPGDTPQPCANNMGNNARCCGAFGFGIATSSDCTSHDLCHVEREGFEEHKSTSTTDECPTFDIGF